ISARATCSRRPTCTRARPLYFAPRADTPSSREQDLNCSRQSPAAPLTISRASGMLDGAGNLAVLSEIQQRVFAEAVEPDAPARIAIADTHRDQPDMRRTA